MTVDNLVVPEGSGCSLDGTQVNGTVKVERGATLTARAIRVVGNLQAEAPRASRSTGPSCAALAGGAASGAGPTSGGGAGPSDDDGHDGAASLAATSLRATRGGSVVSVSVRCARGGAACEGAVRVTRRRARAGAAATGSARFRLAPGARRHVSVRLGRRDRAALRRAGRLRVTVVVSTRGATRKRAAIVRA